jgi:U6 snRNA-associated Sm-like protein LSm2
MIFFSFFKTLIGKEVAVELKNDVVITGILLSVDQYLNVKLKQVNVVNSDAHPQLSAMKNCFIRGSAVRYYLLTSNDCHLELDCNPTSLADDAGTFKFPPARWTRSCFRTPPGKRTLPGN